MAQFITSHHVSFEQDVPVGGKIWVCIEIYTCYLSVAYTSDY